MNTTLELVAVAALFFVGGMSIGIWFSKKTIDTLENENQILRDMHAGANRQLAYHHAELSKMNSELMEVKARWADEVQKRVFATEYFAKREREMKKNAEAHPCD